MSLLKKISEAYSTRRNNGLTPGEEKELEVDYKSLVRHYGGNEKTMSLEDQADLLQKNLRWARFYFAPGEIPIYVTHDKKLEDNRESVKLFSYRASEIVSPEIRADVARETEARPKEAVNPYKRLAGILTSEPVTSYVVGTAKMAGYFGFVLSGFWPLANSFNYPAKFSMAVYLCMSGIADRLFADSRCEEIIEQKEKGLPWIEPDYRLFRPSFAEVRLAKWFYRKASKLVKPGKEQKDKLL